MIIDARVRTYAIQLTVCGLLVATALIVVVTGSSPSWVVPVGLVVAVVPFIVWALLGLVRARVGLLDEQLRVQNPIRGRTVSADQIDRVAIVERWWSYLGYGPIGRFGLSSPTAKLVLVDGSELLISATSPMGEGSTAWTEMSVWCVQHSVSIGWE